MKSERIIIVGAGLAGLSAGYHLKKNGFDPLILEANEIVGGRTKCIDIDGHKVALGADHLTENDHLTKSLCIKHKIKLESISREGHLLKSASEKFHPATDSLFDILTSPALLKKTRFKILSTLPALIYNSYNTNFYEFEKILKYDNYSIKEWVLKWWGVEAYEKIVDPFIRSLSYVNSEDLSTTYFFAILQELVDIKFYRMSWGMDTLAQALAKNLRVQTSTRLDRIKRGEGEIFLISDQDEYYKTKYVIFSTPANITAGFMGEAGFQHPFLSQVKYVSVISLIGKASKKSFRKQFSLRFTRASYKSLMSVTQISELPAKGDDVFFRAIVRSENESDTELGLKELKSAVGEFNIIHLQVWDCAHPMYRPGYFQALHRFGQSSGLPKNIAFAGDYLYGPTIEGVLQSGKLAASRIKAQNTMRQKIK